MIEGIKVSDKWAPISGSPIVNVSRVFYCKTYRRFTVSWVSVKVAWVTFCVSFDNFLQISHCRYPKYFYPIK